MYRSRQSYVLGLAFALVALAGADAQDNPFGIRPGFENIAPLVVITAPDDQALVRTFEEPGLDVDVAAAAFKANQGGQDDTFEWNGETVAGRNHGNVHTVRVFLDDILMDEIRLSPQRKQVIETFTLDLSGVPHGVHDLTAVAFESDPEAGIGRLASRSLRVAVIDDTTPPDCALTSPTGSLITADGTVQVRGEAMDNQSPIVSTTVNETPIALTNGTFSRTFDLRKGRNPFILVVTDLLGNSCAAKADVLRDIEPPHVAFVNPSDGFVTFDERISISGSVNDMASGDDGVTVTVDGMPVEVSHRFFALADFALASGENTITATATDRAGNSAAATLRIVRETAALPRILTISGDGQSGPVGIMLPDPLVVRLVDGNGFPVAGRQVIFRVLSNNGSLTGDERLVNATTAADGTASTHLTLGASSGRGSDAVEAFCVSFEGTALFTASALAGPAARLNEEGGNDQIGAIAQPLPKAFEVIALDADDNPVAGAAVTFTVTGGGGSLAGESSVILLTDDAGQAATTLTPGPEEGFSNQRVRAELAELPGAFPVVFQASAFVPGDPDATGVRGVVLDNQNLPLTGVRVEVVETGLSNRTGGDGFFAMTGVPASRFHLRTEALSVPGQGSFPGLQFEVFPVPGKTFSIGRPISLPDLDQGASLAVDPETGGTLTLPDMEGFSLEISPGSVTFADGSQSGVVTVARVNDNQIPMAPGNAMAPLALVTVQPPGAVFDPPIRVTYPNLEGHGPGARIPFYSFDHDLGDFVIVGTGTVSEDAVTVTSDPGTGIFKAGWHCGNTAGPQGCGGNPKTDFVVMGATGGPCGTPPGICPQSCSAPPSTHYTAPVGGVVTIEMKVWTNNPSCAPGGAYYWSVVNGGTIAPTPVPDDPCIGSACTLPGQGFHCDDQTSNATFECSSAGTFVIQVDWCCVNTGEKLCRQLQIECI